MTNPQSSDISTRLIGAHISASGGYMAMKERAEKLGANTFAFFTRNPRSGAALAFDAADAAAFCHFMKEQNFGRIVAHAPYTMNPCAAKPELRSYAASMFAEDLVRMEATPGQYYNFHPGAHVSQGAETGIRLTAEMLNHCLKPEQTTTVLIETMAGKGTEIGRTFEEVRAIIDQTDLKDHVGVCMDTCHVWDGGYDIAGRLDAVLDEFDRVIGLSRLKAVHLNDSCNPLGAHKDRHAKIGEGCIRTEGEDGTAAFARILHHPALQGLPFILETPNDEAGWKAEIELLRNL